jgi:hypothetical protein
LGGTAFLFETSDDIIKPPSLTTCEVLLLIIEPAKLLSPRFLYLQENWK